MRMHFNISFLALLIACSSSADQKVPSQVNQDEKTSRTDKNVHSTGNSSYDGLYLNEWNNSGVIVIHDGKIHHFTKREFTSIYKDEEYDFAGVNEKGRLLIHRKYSLDRNGKVNSKETLLTDIEPINEKKTTVALVRNGRIFNRISTLKDFLVQFSEVSLADYRQKVIQQLGVEADQVVQALSSKQYYLECGLPYQQLRGGEIEFIDLLLNVTKKIK